MSSHQGSFLAWVSDGTAQPLLPTCAVMVATDALLAWEQGAGLLLCQLGVEGQKELKAV